MQRTEDRKASRLQSTQPKRSVTGAVARRHYIEGTPMHRKAPDPDAPVTGRLVSRRKVTKRALIVLGASLLLQPAGGSIAWAKRRRHRGSNGGLNCADEGGLSAAAARRCKQGAAFNRKLAEVRAAARAARRHALEK